MQRQRLEFYKTWAFPHSTNREKTTLRAELRAQRKTQDPRVARYRDRQMTSRILPLPEIRQARVLALYASLPEEASTEALLEDGLRQGKTICLPRVEGTDIAFYSIQSPDDAIPQGPYGIREPQPEASRLISPESIDCLVAPGVGFDLFGGRIGFGGGYYDRFLQRRNHAIPVVALAYDFQVLHALPTEAEDAPVDRIVTDETLYSPEIQTLESESEAATRQIAHWIVEKGFRQGVLVLHADLGVGKTVFVKGLAEALHCKETTISPTFTYCREYHGDRPLYHIDGYRIDRIADPDTDFWKEMLEQDGIVAIEWGERLDTLIPKDAIHLFGEIDESNRRIWRLFTSARKAG